MTDGKEKKSAAVVALNQYYTTKNLPLPKFDLKPTIEYPASYVARFVKPDTSEIIYGEGTTQLQAYENAAMRVLTKQMPIWQPNASSTYAAFTSVNRPHCLAQSPQSQKYPRRPSLRYQPSWNTNKRYGGYGTAPIVMPGPSSSIMPSPIRRPGFSSQRANSTMPSCSCNGSYHRVAPSASLPSRVTPKPTFYATSGTWFLGHPNSSDSFNCESSRSANNTGVGTLRARNGNLSNFTNAPLCTSFEATPEDVFQQKPALPTSIKDVKKKFVRFGGLSGKQKEVTNAPLCTVFEVEPEDVPEPKPALPSSIESVKKLVPKSSGRRRLAAKFPAPTP